MHHRKAANALHIAIKRKNVLSKRRKMKAAWEELCKCLGTVSVRTLFVYLFICYCVLFGSYAVIRRGQINTWKISSLITTNYTLLTEGSFRRDTTAEFHSTGESFVHRF